MHNTNHPVPRILAVDDSNEILDLYREILKDDYKFSAVSSAAAGLDLLKKNDYDLIISDIAIPGMSGIDFVREVRRANKLIPIILVTGHPTVGTAIKAVELGALRYLTKPIDVRLFRDTVAQGISLQRMGSIREEIDTLMSEKSSDKEAKGIDHQFDQALASLWLAFQPIVSWSGQCLKGYEVLVRNDEPAMVYPPKFFETAETLGRTTELSRIIRSKAALAVAQLPPKVSLFVNLHVRDLQDPQLYAPDAPLTKVSSRVVLELSEQLNLETVDELRSQMDRLRGLGYKIAMDDLGAGHSGLAAFAKIEPDIVKLDIQLIRDAEKEKTKLKLIASLLDICKELNIACISEGVETPENCRALIEKGCDLFQGYLFGKPDRALKPFFAPF